jgi:hypothetical protein
MILSDVATNPRKPSNPHGLSNRHTAYLAYLEAKSLIPKAPPKPKLNNVTNSEISMQGIWNKMTYDEQFRFKQASPEGQLKIREEVMADLAKKEIEMAERRRLTEKLASEERRKELLTQLYGNKKHPWPPE